LRFGGAQHGEQARRNLAVQSQTGLGLKSLDRTCERVVAAAARVGHEAELLQNDARLDELGLIPNHALPPRVVISGTCAPREATQTSFAVSSSTSRI